jgi:hypothetical protein
MTAGDQSMELSIPFLTLLNYVASVPDLRHRSSRMLKSFGIISETIRLDQNKTLKGYLVAHFDDAFGRYLT